MSGETTKQYFLHGLLLHGGNYINELTDLTPNPNIELLTSYAGAAVAPSFRGGQQAEADMVFSTPDLKNILDECTGGDGVSLADYSAGNVDALFRRATNFGTRALIGAASHLVIRAKRSLMAWQRIEASQDQAATIEARVVPTFDGTNNPLAGLGSQTIASNLMVEQEYTLGPVKLNNTFVDGVTRVTIEQGLVYQIKRSSGQVFPTFAGIQRTDPIVTIEGPDLDYWTSIGMIGLQLTALLVYFRKRQPDLTRCYPDASAVHIKFSNTDNPCGMALVESGGGGIDGEATCSLKCAMRISTATTLHPFTVNTAAAIA